MTVVRFGKSTTGDLSEAIELLNDWCSLFFGRDPDMSHITTEEYIKRHTEQFTKTADWLRAKGYRR